MKNSRYFLLSFDKNIHKGCILKDSDGITLILRWQWVGAMVAERKGSGKCNVGEESQGGKGWRKRVAIVLEQEENWARHGRSLKQSILRCILLLPLLSHWRNYSIIKCTGTGIHLEINQLKLSATLQKHALKSTLCCFPTTVLLVNNSLK